MNLRNIIRRKAHEAIVDVRNIDPSWTEFYTLIETRAGYIVWDVGKHEVVCDAAGSTRLFTYIGALKYACTAPRVCAYLETV